MKRVVLITLLSIIGCQLSIAQVGTWKAYMSYYEPQQIIKVQNTLFVRASNDLYQYNLNDQSITTYDKTNSLSDSNIRLIEWNNETKRLIIVYYNSNIDFMDVNGNVNNLSALYNKSMTQKKGVNSIYMNGIYAYLATDFGVIKINTQRYEISETYMLNMIINAVAIKNGFIYAKNNTGTILSASLSKNLLDSNNWTIDASASNDLFNQDQTTWNEYKQLVSTLKPGGPKYNCFGFMKYANNRLYSCGGDVGMYTPATVQILKDNDWQIYNDDSVKTFSGRMYFSNLYSLDYDPHNSEHLFVGTSNGLYEFLNGKILNYYNETNSPIETAIPITSDINSRLNYQLVTSVKFDNNSNLWLLNSQAITQSILMLTKNGEWVQRKQNALINLNQNNASLGIRSAANMSNMMFDHRGLMWFCNNSYFVPAFYKYDINNDQLTGYLTKGSPPSYINQDGTVVTVQDGVRTVSEDQNGNIWISSNNGLFLLESDRINEDGDTYLTQVKVPRNDGTNYADYLLNGSNILCMATDGGHRKWIGTAGDGVYVISSDNMVQEQHFLSSNSPLLSDNILSIAINNNTGEVFIGTDQGLCSYMSDATTPATEMIEDNIYAYPNPVQPDYNGPITIVGLSYDADVKILSVSGQLVNQGRSTGGTYIWNGCDMKGKRVASGIYMVATATNDGKKGIVCKIAIIK